MTFWVKFLVELAFLSKNLFKDLFLKQLCLYISKLTELDPEFIKLWSKDQIKSDFTIHEKCKKIHEKFFTTEKSVCFPLSIGNFYISILFIYLTLYILSIYLLFSATNGRVLPTRTGLPAGEKIKIVEACL